ncbi:MAG TPA: YkgJ family cysteine cluster protein, partial [archaeon]|nr:YkgJ family cysteine cluster protein [archaeon]
MPEFYPVFTKDEVDLLIKKGIDKNNFTSEDGKHYTVVFKEKEGLHNLCPFVRDNMLCSIYENRPVDCKIWPFAIIRKEKGIYLAIDTKELCPGIKKRVGTEEYGEYVRYLIDYFGS